MERRRRGPRCFPHQARLRGRRRSPMIRSQRRWCSLAAITEAETAAGSITATRGIGMAAPGYNKLPRLAHPRERLRRSDDSSLGEVVVFGGTSGPPNALNDTWGWNGKTWEELSLATEPSARYVSSVDFDSTTDGLVLFWRGVGRRRSYEQHVALDPRRGSLEPFPMHELLGGI